MSNRLAAATSPYLRQHAENPVDWWQWSEEAFAEARRRDVPVLLSVGYAACHWCHVMAHESFEDEAAARVMNERFVAVKVDREERPDIDAVYMAATQVMTGGGGWPMTVFLDHDGQAFYAGTYFPPTPRPGMPSFTQVLAALDETWRTDRARVLTAATRLTETLAHSTLPIGGGGAPSEADVVDAIRRVATEFDARRGGFGGAPKFPPSPVLEFLLRASSLLERGSGRRTGAQTAGDAGGASAAAQLAEDMAGRTLRAMARGGMYDQLAGGFARYSVDADWVVPHFEKMLYDNAQLLRVYAHWWRASGEPLARRVAEETAEFLITELQTTDGGFASSLDADSEGREGAFYVWTPDQLVDVLGAEDGAWVAQLCAVTPHGTFEEGASVLQLRDDPQDAGRWRRCRDLLVSARATRPRPARDDKVVAAWNGLALAALAEAGALFDEPHLVAAAVRCAEHLHAVLWSASSRQLLRVSLSGRPNLDARGVLEDYADLAEGLLALYQVTGDERWFRWAGELLDVVLDRFREDGGGFFDTASDAPRLVRRPQDPTDGVAASGWAAATQALVTLGALNGEHRFRQAADEAIAALLPLARRSPRFTGWSWAAITAALAGPVQVAVVLPTGPAADGGPADVVGASAAAPPTARDPLHDAALRSTSPGLVVAVGRDGDGTLPLLRDRPTMDGRPTAYPCRGFVCDLPVTSVQTLQDAIAR